MLQMFIFFLLPYMVPSLKCFKCHVVEYSEFYPNETLNLCEKFDHSQRFVGNCENSSFCRKTIIKGDINSVKVGVERECVNPVYNIVVKYHENGSWYKAYDKVIEAYSEGCFVMDNYGVRSVSIQNCYCKTDWCNSALTLSLGSLLYAAWFPITLL